ncbi:kelch repeat-containing protein [Corallococcus sp. AS-1-12]|uniref:Kelch repeat-containing protein n=1 Tax=Corallococcus sp. AS-1-12 TaxID=2874598 RepID=UPI001CBD46CD|nr:kelch repeat-containing protein [Corallococcus sp. AS-1-12]MBZ4329465.1 kelch-like protein [Corallococcus sp. AS-1-12]
MKRAGLHLILVLAAALCAGCGNSAGDTGTARFAVSVPQSLSSTIARVAVASGGPDIPSVWVDLAPTNGVWGGTIGNIPAGTDRAFAARAYDASGTLLFSGSASGVTILANQTTFVAITLQQLHPPPPFDNEAPVIEFVVAYPSTVTAGGTVSLHSSAQDPNPGDTIAYAWSATAGTFASTTERFTSWTAPMSTGIQTLTLTVTDSRGLASSAILVVNVLPEGEGEAELSISFNSAPEVSSLDAAPTQLVVGQPTTVSVTASDPDGDSLSYAWSASCAGTWTDAVSSTARFTPSLAPAEACNNCRLSVSVSDGRGGHNTGTVALCVTSTPPVNHLEPVIVRSYRSSDTASPDQVLTYEVVASDPEGSTLSFAWDSSVGTTGTPVQLGTHSRVTWTAPTCIRPGTTPTVTVTVTNAFDLTTSRSFTVEGLPDCTLVGHWDPTGPMGGGPRWGHTATLLQDGRVLIAGGSAQKRSFYLDTTELFDPATNTWSAGAPMNARRLFHSATLLLDGRVLVAGGEGLEGVEGFSNGAELYDPTTNTWTRTGSMAQGRSRQLATLLPDGKVLVAGGEDINGYLTSSEVYDPATGTWSPAGAMAEPHFSTAPLLPTGKVLAVGVTEAELYDPATRTWSLAHPPLAPVGSEPVVLFDGKVLVAGGKTAQLYDPFLNTWCLTGAPLEPIGGPAVRLADGRVLVVAPSLAELYAPDSGTWSMAPAPAIVRIGYTVTALPDGRALIAGTPPNTEIDEESAEVYTP